jgi:hypothetical protein
MLARQVKKLMCDVAKVVAIKSIRTAEFYLKSVFFALVLLFFGPVVENTGNQVFFCDYYVYKKVLKLGSTTLF